MTDAQYPGTEGRDRIACGIDVVAIERIERLLDRFGESFVDRVYTPAEAEYCRSRADPPQHFAARWAAKEAAVKALPTPDSGQSVTNRQVEVVRGDDGPRIELSGVAAAAATELGDPEIAVSLAHDRTLGEATAQVVVLLPESETATGGEES